METQKSDFDQTRWTTLLFNANCVGLVMDRVPVNSARQQGKLRSTVDMTPFEQFDLSDLVFSALEWRVALAQSGAARLAQSICRPTFWSSLTSAPS